MEMVRGSASPFLYAIWHAVICWGIPNLGSQLGKWSSYFLLSGLLPLFRNFYYLGPKFLNLHSKSILKQYTPPTFNIAPEKWWLEDYFPVRKTTFQGLCWTSGGVCIFYSCWMITMTMGVKWKKSSKKSQGPVFQHAPWAKHGWWHSMCSWAAKGGKEGDGGVAGNPTCSW